MDDIMSSGAYAASQRYVREMEERFNVSFKEELSGGGLPVAALVSIHEGTLVKHTMPAIYNPEKEIKKETREIQKYSLAVKKKEDELVTLRKNEDFVGITTAAKYKKEYQGYIDRATMRLQHLKKQAPALIAQSIEQAKLFINMLDEEKKKAMAIIKQAEEMKSSYEKAE